MALSLYDVSIPNYLQILNAVDGILDKGAAFAAEQGEDSDDYTQLRLRDDMAPLSFQVISVWHHSLGAIKGVKAGLFQPPPDQGQLDYAALRGLVTEAIAEVSAQTREDIDALADQPMMFKAGKFELPFNVTNFIQSFSIPNFYFHATTTYDLLRMHGVPLGKMDFLGSMRIG